MFGPPINPNLIFIPTVQRYLKAEFDSTYPVRLQGIINPEEFQQSIKKINRAICSNAWALVVALLSLACFIGGIICSVFAGIQGTKPDGYGFYALVGLGIGLSFFSLVVLGVGCCLIQTQRSARIREAISKESAKYSSRFPIPCSWRLNMSKGLIDPRHIHTQHNPMIYHIAIDIGRANALESGTTVYYLNALPSSTPAVSFDLPPPYSAEPIATCLKCGIIRQDLTEKFCSSCGGTFEKF